MGPARQPAWRPLARRAARQSAQWPVQQPARRSALWPLVRRPAPQLVRCSARQPPPFVILLSTIISFSMTCTRTRTQSHITVVSLRFRVIGACAMRVSSVAIMWRCTRVCTRLRMSLYMRTVRRVELMRSEREYLRRVNLKLNATRDRNPFSFYNHTRTHILSLHYTARHSARTPLVNTPSLRQCGHA